MKAKPTHPFSSRTFQRHQEHDLKHPCLVDVIITKQNKLPSFIDSYTYRAKVVNSLLTTAGIPLTCGSKALKDTAVRF